MFCCWRIIRVIHPYYEDPQDLYRLGMEHKRKHDEGHSALKGALVGRHINHLSKAQEYLREAADRGSSEAAFEYGKLKLGEDLDEGKGYIQLAADNGNQLAKQWLEQNSSNTGYPLEENF